MANASENIGKHLIEITSYDWPWYRGLVVKETERTFSVQKPRERVNRVNKTSMCVLLDASSDPEAACKVYSDTRKSFEAEIDGLSEQIREIRRRQRDAAIAAMNATT